VIAIIKLFKFIAENIDLFVRHYSHAMKKAMLIKMVNLLLGEGVFGPFLLCFGLGE
jgi:hypothetical protein